MTHETDAMQPNQGCQQWLAHLDDMLCAAYAVRNDAHLTLVAGNEAFYALLGCDKEEMRLKYGGRLAALMLKTEGGVRFDVLASGVVEKPVKHLQQIKHAGTTAWLEVTTMACGTPEGTVLCCTAIDITLYEERRRALLCFERTLCIAAAHAGVDYFEYDFSSQGAVIRSACSVLPASLVDEAGCCPNFIARLVHKDIVVPRCTAALQKAFTTVREGDGKAVCEVQLYGAGATLVWARFTMALEQGGQQAAGIVEDITQEKEAALNYLNETQFYQAMLSERVAFAQVDVTENRITRIGGMWNLYNEVIHRVTYSDLITEFINKVVHPEDRSHYLEVMQRNNFTESLSNGVDQLGCEFRRIVSQNKMVWMELSVHLFRNPLTQHVHALLTIQNIDEKKKQELFLLRTVQVDQLTNMYNKKVAIELMREHLAQADSNELCAFIILDMDDFKGINDTKGHAAGDRVLVRLADILSSAFRRSDIIGRLGGDEFLLFLKNVGSKERVASRLENLYKELYADEDYGPLLCSAGGALALGSVPYERLFQQADTALYYAKTAGKNQFYLLDENDRSAEISPEGQHVMFHTAEMLAALQDTRSVQNLAYLEEDSAAFDAFMGEQGDIAYLCDKDTFELVCGNKAFFDRIGMTSAQCAGMKCYELMQKRESPCPFCSRANWSSDKFYLWRNLNRVLEQEFLLKNRLIDWQHREVLLTIAVDISNDKSIVDSMENGAMETHSILSAVECMAKAPSLVVAMNSVMETIGSFFRADAVRLWQYQPKKDLYVNTYSWCRPEQASLTSEDCKEINTWLDGRSWEQPVVLESPEAMLGDSYGMYKSMKRNCTRNQRWVAIKENAEPLGWISIDNISSNFQNVAFLGSLEAFIASELKKRSLMEGALHAQQYDDLTSLLSRKSLENYMAQYDPDEVACVGVIVANFNNLKEINSSRGFKTGNYFIQQFAEMLREVFTDKLAFRLNGDEFLVIAPDITRIAALEEIQRLEALVIKGNAFTVSVGFAWDDMEKDLSVLLDQATQVMKVNKKRHYDVGHSFVDTERRKMLSDLTLSIENNEFEVFLQPKVELVHGTVVGAEALIRYHHKVNGYIAPAMFIDLLEKNNLIRYIDLFVFEQVCRCLEQWKAQGLFLPVVSLNFSRLTLLEKDILASMEAIISQYDVERANVEIEITESVAGMSKSVLHQVAQSIFKAGYPISLDDFGTKYTNLSILADLEFNVLKIDKSLVWELGLANNYGKIMKNIISMCKDLNLEVLAEGVETKAQEKILQTLGCEFGQGYLYGRPMPIAEFVEKHGHIDHLDD